MEIYNEKWRKTWIRYLNRFLQIYFCFHSVGWAQQWWQYSRNYRSNAVGLRWENWFWFGDRLCEPWKRCRWVNKFLIQFIETQIISIFNTVQLSFLLLLFIKWCRYFYVYRLHTLNEGRTAINTKTGFVPCTPNGCIELIKRTGIPIAGARAVVLGT